MSLDSDNWEQLQALYHLASQAPEEEREQVLSQACLDPELRRRAIALLTSGDFDLETEQEPEPKVLTGKIGPYTLVRLIGSGGIGVGLSRGASRQWSRAALSDESTRAARCRACVC